MTTQNSAMTTSTKLRERRDIRKEEKHRKTMLKVMDPNVHQMQIGRRDPSRFKDGGSDDDDGDEDDNEHDVRGGRHDDLQ